jgi:hypothetical protein
MDYSLECALHAQRSAAEALAEHFVDKNDTRAMELFDDLLDAQKMLLTLMNDWKRKDKTPCHDNHKRP